MPALVLSIIGILLFAGISVGGFVFVNETTATNQADGKALTQLLDDAAYVVNEYRAQNGTLPVQLSDLQGLGLGSTDSLKRAVSMPSNGDETPFAAGEWDYACDDASCRHAFVCVSVPNTARGQAAGQKAVAMTAGLSLSGACKEDDAPVDGRLFIRRYF